MCLCPTIVATEIVESLAEVDQNVLVKQHLDFSHGAKEI
jgi:hypothetical protein